MKYTIVLRKPEDGALYALEYAVADHPTARKWALLARKAIFWGRGRPASAKYYLAEAATDLQPLIGEINSRLRAINEAGAIAIDEPELTPLTLDQNRLNRIHAAFHFHEEDAGAELFPSPSRTKLRELNVLVHQCETAMRNSASKTKQQALVVSLKYARTSPLEESDYDRFTVNSRFGDLFMAYGTVGKPLFHCFNDDDLELLRARRVRPQLAASPEVRLSFPSADSPPDYEARYLERYRDWCERNRALDFGYDCTAQRHRPGSALIGRLLNDVDFGRISAILKTHSQVSHVLLED